MTPIPPRPITSSTSYLPIFLYPAVIRIGPVESSRSYPTTPKGKDHLQFEGEGEVLLQGCSPTQFGHPGSWQYDSMNLAVRSLACGLDWTGVIKRLQKLLFPLGRMSRQV